MNVNIDPHSTRSLLEQLELLFKDHSSWVQHTSVANAEGYSVDRDSPKAVSWCLAAGFNRVGEDFDLETRRAAHHALLNATGAVWSLVPFNDSPATTHADIVKAIRKAKKLV